ncbi:aldehyde dehydrogenase family protein [Gemmobacter sp. 24YEA27]|uniref:aldehyde dehydrogenase family protein n=1 Tax=Gemmobacter sp. 24YEA27 TaxID=3040672 RepID=UPI0024B3AD3C|nr:aldehyde dehydrogenase family protein [Gemmobacter sp. 24YEA27]
MTDELLDTDLDWAKSWLKESKKQYINGEWVAGNGAAWGVKNPATGETLCQIALADAGQIETAAEAANRCHQTEAWSRKTSRKARADQLIAIARLIRENVKHLALLESLANGKTYVEAVNDDIYTCAEIFEYYAGWTDKFYGEVSPVEDGFLNFTTKEPVGVCALIAPWNYPLYQASLKIAPALAMGNAVVMKPSEYTPLATLHLFELIDRELDLPKGLLNLVLCDGAAANQLTLSRNVHKVSFTGSTGVGRRIVANSGASNLKGVTLELGGKSPCIFFEDTLNLDAAIDRAFYVMFSQKGEKCSEPTRFLIQKGIYDYVLEKLIAKAEAVTCGDPLLALTEQGAQCNEAQFKRIMEYIEIGKTEAELVAGGIADTSGSNAKGLFVRPTIFSNVPDTARIAQEEIFGPVLSCTPFETADEAVRIANGTSYGLAAGVYTGNVNLAHRMAERLDAGMVFVNRYGCYGLSAPFGGFKESGWGKEMAIHSLSSYTKTKGTWIHFGG